MPESRSPAASPPLSASPSDKSMFTAEGRVGIVGPVDAVAAVQQVGTDAAIEHVVAALAAQDVVAAVAEPTGRFRRSRAGSWPRRRRRSRRHGRSPEQIRYRRADRRQLYRHAPARHPPGSRSRPRRNRSSRPSRCRPHHRARPRQPPPRNTSLPASPRRMSLPPLPIRRSFPEIAAQAVGHLVTDDHIVKGRAEDVFDTGEAIAFRIASGLRRGVCDVDADNFRGVRIVRPVDAVAAFQRVGAGAAAQDVVAILAAQRIVAVICR